MLRRFLAICIVSMTLSLPLAMAQTETETDTFLLNARGVPIETFADDVSVVTGRTLILDPGVNGTVSVISQEPLDADGVWELFQSVLRVQGYATFRSGDIWRIVPLSSARQGAPISGTSAAIGADIVTKLIPLSKISPSEAASSVKPFLSSTGTVEAFSRPNALIITGYADEISRVERIVQQLDRTNDESLATISLTHASAADTVATLERLLVTGGSGPRIAADIRSNQIFLRGTAKEVFEAQRLVGSIDKPSGAVVATRVFRLNHSDAETIIEVLRGVVITGQAPTNPVARNLVSKRGFGGDQSTETASTQLATLTSNPATGFGDTGSNTGRSPAGRPIDLTSGAQQGQAGPAGEGLSLQAATDINAIVARGTGAELAEVANLLSELDVRRPQVSIEAAIVEINGDIAEQFGVQIGLGNAAPPGSAGAVSFSDQGLSLRRILSILGAPAAIGLTDDGLSAGVSSGGDLGVLIQAFGSSAQANLLSTPSITTLDNHPAQIVVGQNVPFRTGSFSTTGNSTNPFTTIERQDVGITLRVFPRIYDGDVVRLDVTQEVSSLVNSVVPGASDLVTNRRIIETTVLADNGSTIVLGGLISDDRISGESKVPVLGDVPVVGNLFKSQSESGTRRSLFVFLRPTILRHSTDIDNLSSRRVRDLTGARNALYDTESLLLEKDQRPLTIGVDAIY